MYRRQYIPIYTPTHNKCKPIHTPIHANIQQHTTTYPNDTPTYTNIPWCRYNACAIHNGQLLRLEWHTWAEPKVCRGGVTLPTDQRYVPCEPCKKGQKREGTACVQCPQGTYGACTCVHVCVCVYVFGLCVRLFTRVCPLHEHVLST